MQVRVLLFGVLKDLAGLSCEDLTLPNDATAGDVVTHYEQKIGNLRGMVSSIAISVNQEYSPADARLRPGDEVALLPPVSGGSPGPPTLGKVLITFEKIDTAANIEQLKSPEDGAAVIFEGVVRNHTRDRQTKFLDYEAYEPMAVKQLELLAEQARSQFQIHDVSIVHRLGRLEIGETSVLIVVVSPHRAAAFEACRWVIDTLKKTVPIWKKEYFADGAVWADGEPFPEQLTAGTISKVPASK